MLLAMVYAEEVCTSDRLRCTDCEDTWLQRRKLLCYCYSFSLNYIVLLRLIDQGLSVLAGKSFYPSIFRREQLIGITYAVAMFLSIVRNGLYLARICSGFRSCFYISHTCNLIAGIIVAKFCRIGGTSKPRDC